MSREDVERWIARYEEAWRAGDAQAAAALFTEDCLFRSHPFRDPEDVGNAVARDYGLVFTQSAAATAASRQLGIELADFNGDDSHTLPAASTFVIGEQGVVRFASVSGDYRWRVGPEEVLAALRG